MKNFIDPKLCSRCKICSDVCPAKIIDITSDSNLYFSDEKSDLCLCCGQCMAVCTTKAIQIEGLQYGIHIIDLPEKKISSEEFMNFIARRRSIRNFKKEAVPDEILKKIAENIAFAPFGASPEKMHLTIINGREKIEKTLPLLSEFLDNVAKWVESPIISRMIRFKKGTELFNTLKNHLYPRVKKGNYKLEKGDRITRGAPSILIFHAHRFAEGHSNNGMIYAVYAALAAESLGYGATIIEIVPAAINKVPELKAMYGIPSEHEAVMSVIVGKAKYKYKHAVKHDTLNVHFA